MLYRAIHKLHRQARGQGEFAKCLCLTTWAEGESLDCLCRVVDKLGLYIFEYMTKNRQNIPILTYVMRVHRIVTRALRSNENETLILGCLKIWPGESFRYLLAYVTIHYFYQYIVSKMF